MSALRNIYHDFFLVWTFFTRIPAPNFSTQRSLVQALWTLPVLAVLLGSAQASVYFIFRPLLSNQDSSFLTVILAIFLVVTPIKLTGALHWDGLADLADGMGVPKNRRMEVMRDPKIGTFGVLSLVIAFSVQLAALSHLINVLDSSEIVICFIAVSLLSRQTMIVAWSNANEEGANAKTAKGRPSRRSALIVWLLIFFTVAVSGFLSGLALLALVGFLVGVLTFNQMFLPEMSGDAIGATQIFTETFLFIMIAIIYV